MIYSTSVCKDQETTTRESTQNSRHFRFSRGFIQMMESKIDSKVWN